MKRSAALTRALILAAFVRLVPGPRSLVAVCCGGRGLVVGCPICGRRALDGEAP